MAPHGPARENFPSGDIPDEDGYGLAIRAPLCVHRLSMHRYPFVNREGEPLVPGSIVCGQIEWLYAHAVRNDPTPHVAAVELMEAQERALKEGLRAGKKEQRLFESPIKTWSESQGIREVVEAYMPLNKRGVGRCPWPEHHHERDRHPSFQVYEGTNRFWCYNARIGGDSANFVMKMEGIPPREFVARDCAGGQATRAE